MISIASMSETPPPPATPEPVELAANLPAIPSRYPFNKDFMQVSSYEQGTYLQLLWEKYLDVAHSLGSRVGPTPLNDHLLSVGNDLSLIKKVDSVTLNPLQLLAPVMFGNYAIGEYKRISESLESWFTESWVKKLVDTVSMITEISSKMFASGSFPISPIHNAVRKVAELHEEAQKESDSFFAFHQKLNKAIKSTLNIMQVPNEEVERAREVMMVGASLIHDLNNINTAVLGASELGNFFLKRGNNQEAMEKILETIGIFKYDYSESAANLALRLLSPRGRDYDVSVSLSSKVNLKLPSNMEFAYFRSIYELLLNSIKYRDPNKATKIASIRQFIRGNNFVTTIEDNGSGIENVESALNPGNRFHQHLAGGTGMGLASVSKLAQQHGWNFSIHSTPGIGTMATIEMGLKQLPMLSANPAGQMFNSGTFMHTSPRTSPLPFSASNFAITSSMAFVKTCWLH